MSYTLRFAIGKLLVSGPVFLALLGGEGNNAVFSVGPDVGDVVADICGDVASDTVLSTMPK